MIHFFNKTRTPLNFSSRDGGMITVGPKAWLRLEAGEVTSSVLAAVLRGDLMRKKEDPVVDPPVTEDPPSSTLVLADPIPKAPEKSEAVPLPPLLPVSKGEAEKKNPAPDSRRSPRE